MNFTPAIVIDYLMGSGLAATLLITLSTSLALGWQAWRLGGNRAAEYLCLTAASLLACSAITLPYLAFGAITGTNSAMWSGPLDRFAGTVLLVTLALALTTTQSTPRIRIGLLVVLGLAAIGWSTWAGVWAELYRTNPARFATSDPSGLSAIWDLALAGAAAALTFVLWRRPKRPPTWLLATVGLLALGALLDALYPLSFTAAVWTRLGTLCAALVLTTTSVSAPWAAGTRESAASIAARRLRKIVRGGGAEFGDRSAGAMVGAGLLTPDAAAGARVPTHLVRAETIAVAELRSRVADLDRRLVEQARVANDARMVANLFNSSIERLPIPLVVLDPVGRVLASSPSAGRRLHIALDVGASLPALMQPTVADSVARALREVKTKGRTQLEVEVSGTKRALELQALVDERGGHAGSLLLVDPVVGIPERAGEIVPSLVEALRGPVRSLMAFSSLATGTHRLPEADIENHFAILNSTLRRLDVLLANLCTALEIEEGTPAPHRPGAIADVADVLRACVERAQPQFSERDGELGLSVDGWLPPALVDTQVLAQIVDNLLTNAAACSPYGSRTILRATIDRSSDHRSNVRIRIDYRDRGTADSGGESQSSIAARPALLIARILTERARCGWREGVDDDGGARVEVRIPAKVA